MTHPYPQQPYAPPGAYPAAPQYPQQPGPYPYPPQQPQPAQAYPQQPGPYPYPPQPPADPGPPATLSDFMSQPASAGGKSLSFNVPGTRYVGTVIRNVTSADIERATELGRGGVATHPDGRVKLVMKVPLLMAPSPEYPTGIGVWYVKASERADLISAMEAAGESGAPKAGDVIDITYTHDEPTRAGMSPRKVKRVTYAKGNGQPPELPQAQAAPGYPQQAYAPYPAAPAQGQPGVTYYAAAGPAPGTAYQPPPYTVNTGLNPYPTTSGALPPTAAPPAPAPGAPPTAAASPSSPAASPADWPADVPFIPGLTPEQARIAMTMRHPAAADR